MRYLSSENEEKMSRKNSHGLNYQVMAIFLNIFL
ncbi:hypothetical protein AusDCA_3132 [Desulfitobacterium sp. AusDCA]